MRYFSIILIFIFLGNLTPLQAMLPEVLTEKRTDQTDKGPRESREFEARQDKLSSDEEKKSGFKELQKEIYSAYEEEEAPWLDILIMNNLKIIWSRLSSFFDPPHIVAARAIAAAAAAVKKEKLGSTSMSSETSIPSILKASRNPFLPILREEEEQKSKSVKTVTICLIEETQQAEEEGESEGDKKKQDVEKSVEEPIADLKEVAFFPGHEEVDAYSMEFAQIRMQFKKELKDLKKKLKNNPEELQQDAAKLYADFYSGARLTLQRMQKLIQENHEMQHECTALILADMTLKVLEMGARSVPSNEIKPLRRIYLDKFKKKRPLDPPIEIINLQAYELEKLSSQDLADEVIISIANDAFENLNAFKKVLKCSPQEIGVFLRQAEIQRLRRDINTTDVKAACIQAKINFMRYCLPKEKADSNLLNQLIEEVDSVHGAGRVFFEKLKQIEAGEAIADPLEAKRIAVVEIFSLVKSELDTAENFKRMLVERREEKQKEQIYQM